MRYAIHKVEQGYVAVSNIRTLSGTWVYVNGHVRQITKESLHNGLLVEVSGYNAVFKDQCKEIIATCGFYLKDLCKFDIQNIEGIGEEFYSLVEGMSNFEKGCAQQGFITGYKEAQSKGIYTEKDIRTAIWMGRMTRLRASDMKEDGFAYTKEQIIESLDRSKEPTAIEAEFYPKRMLIVKQLHYD